VGRELAPDGRRVGTQQVDPNGRIEKVHEV
jgi:hypothetical protein